MKLSKTEWIINELFLRSWWVIIVLILCLAFYEHEQKKRSEVSEALAAKVKELQLKRISALKAQSSLSTQIASQSDPGWIELILMKELGLTPEGQIKVFFSQ